MTETILIAILGGLIGFSSSVFGLGGNILIVPLLPLIIDLELPSVIATGIFTVLIVTFVNTLHFYRQGLLDFRLVTFLFLPTSVTSFISSHYAHLVPEPMIRIVFLGVMAGILMKLFRKKSTQQTTHSQTYIQVLLLSAGALSGLLAGLTGIGTGVILTPLLLSLAVTDERNVSPTINFLIMVSCFFSSINYLSWQTLSFPTSGLVHLDTALYLSIPALLSAIQGRKLNSTIDPRKRKIIVAVALLTLMVKLSISWLGF